VHRFTVKIKSKILKKPSRKVFRFAYRGVLSLMIIFLVIQPLLSVRSYPYPTQTYADTNTYQLATKTNWFDENYLYRKQLILQNNSASVVHSGATVMQTIDTKTLVDTGFIQPDCADFRIVYSGTNPAIEKTRYLDFAEGENCATSTATKVYFNLSADIPASGQDTNYHIYYGNGSASSPLNTDDAFNVGAKNATLVCPFDGTTSCAGGESPSTVSGPVRYEPNGKFIEEGTTNKITNPSFENGTFNTNWVATQPYTLQDEFTTTRLSENVNGTNSEDLFGNSTGNVRTVVDSSNHVTVASGYLTYAGTADAPITTYPLTNRVNGRLLLFNYNAAGANSIMRSIVGYKSGSTIKGISFWQMGGGVCGSGFCMGYTSASTNGIALDATVNFSNATLITRSTGNYVFARRKSDSRYVLLWSDSIDNDALFNPVIYAWGGQVCCGSDPSKYDSLRIPTATYLPTPLAYDTFSSAGATTTEPTGPDNQNTPQLTWSGGAKVGGKMVITPALEGEKVTNGNFTSWTDDNPDGWTTSVENAIYEISEVGNGELHGGSETGFANFYVSSGVVYPIISQSIMTLGQWYQTSIDINNVGSGSIIPREQGYWNIHPYSTVGTKIATARSVVNSSYIIGSQGVVDITIDNFSLRPLALPSLFSTVPTSDADVIADVKVSTLTTDTQAGLVLNLDSTTNPQNFILVYLDGTNIKVEEMVGGVYGATAKQTTAMTGALAYSNTAVLRVVRDGTKLRVYYNNTPVGSELTMTANTNTTHGLFSTYSGNTFDDFTLFARGTGGEYSQIPAEPSEQLLATENAIYTKTGGKSAKLVNTSTLYPYQYVTSASLTVPNTHTLSAYDALDK